MEHYDKAKIDKNKYKVILKGFFIEQDNKEYVWGEVRGELKRDYFKFNKIYFWYKLLIKNWKLLNILIHFI